MNYLRFNRKKLTRFVKFCCVSIPIAVLAASSLLYFGNNLSPARSNQEQSNYKNQAIETLTYSNSLVKRCIDAQSADMQDDCSKLYETLESLQRTLDLGAQESIARSTFHSTHLDYWQFLAVSSMVILMILIVSASYAFLHEVNQANKFLQATLKTSSANRETELQPYLSIVAIAVQTGEPPFGGGNGWIDITFKNLGKTPARNFCNHYIEKTPDPLSSQYVEILDGAPVVHTIQNPVEQSQTNRSPETILLDFINIGEERTARCPIITDIPDRRVKQLYMETEWERRNERVKLPKFEGYRIRGSIDFSNFVHSTTTRRLKFELTDSIDNGKCFKIIEDKRIV